MDDILQQAIGQAGITDAPTSANNSQQQQQQRQLQPRPVGQQQQQVVRQPQHQQRPLIVHQRNGTPQGQRLRVVSSAGQPTGQTVYRTTTGAIIRQSPGRPPTQQKNIIVVGNQVRQTPQTVVIQPSNGQIAENGTTTTRIVQRGRPAPTHTVRQVTTTPQSQQQVATRVLVQKSSTTPQAVRAQPRRQLYPVNTSSQSPQTVQLIRVQQGPNPGQKIVTTSTGQAARINSPTTTQIVRKRIIQQTAPTPPQQAPQPPPAPQQRQQDTTPRRGRVSVQCQPAKNGRPGYLVVTSDFSENLRSTFTQLHRCFSTHYGDIVEIDDGEHALMPKLKNIYKTADKSYQDYLSRNPIKILENLKTLSDGREVTLEAYLQSEQKHVVTHQTVYRATPQRIITTTTTPNQIGTKRLIPRGEFGLVKRIPQQQQQQQQQTQNQLTEGEYTASPDRGGNDGHQRGQNQVMSTRPAPPPPPEKDPTRIELRLREDQDNQTSQMNVNEPFDNMDDVTQRLIPFHCAVEPIIKPIDEDYAENEIMEPFCSSLLERKRRLEQRIRWRFNNDNRSLAEGEDLLMERLAIEMERDEMRETRAKQKRTKDLNHNQNTVHQTQQQQQHTAHHHHHHHHQMDEIDENDHAVKGLLDAF